MRDAPRQVTMFGPRCGSPIVWSATPIVGGEQLEVSAWSCGCPLDDDEWDDLADEAGGDLGGAAGGVNDAGEIRRVVEDDPV